MRHRFRKQIAIKIFREARNEKPKRYSCILCASFLSALVWAAQDAVTAVHGTITKLDSGTKTMVVKTKDGSEHTIKFVDTTTVRGVEAGPNETAMGSADSFHG